MSFLDNLESTLKNMESANDVDPRREQRLRVERSQQSRAAAPFAEELKKGPFVNEFLTHAVRIGHRSRTKINMSWIGSTLRVDAKERRLELRPTADGIQAVYYEDGDELSAEIVDLKRTSPEAFAEHWLS